VIQACGRVVRSPEDFGRTYLADTSLLDLFERSRGAMPEWFEAQVERMSRPELPNFDPDAADGSGDSATANRRARHSRSDPEDHPLADVWRTD
jgi:hypothetical protein